MSLNFSIGQSYVDETQLFKNELSNIYKMKLKQDKELSQLFKYEQKLRDQTEKNEEKLKKQFEKQQMIKAKNDERKERSYVSQVLKQEEIDAIRSKEMAIRIQRRNQLEQSLKKKSDLQEQKLREIQQQKLDQSIMKSVYVADTMDKCRDYNEQTHQQKQQQLDEKLRRMNLQIEQRLSEKAQKQWVKKVEGEVNRDLQKSINEIHENIVKSKTMGYLHKIEEKDSLSEQVLFEEQRRRKEKLDMQKIQWEDGYQRAVITQQKAEEFRDLKRQQFLRKLEKVDQINANKQLLKQQQKDFRSQVEAEKFQMQNEFERKYSKNQKANTENHLKYIGVLDKKYY